MSSPYKRLTPKKRSIGGHTQMWIAPDHLLLVNSSRVMERYQRFALTDIQAIVVSDGPDRTILQAIAVLASLVWGALALLVNLSFEKWFFIVTASIMLALAIRDIARGPRCRCVLHTAVNQWPLRPVSRQRIAKRVLASVVPAIEAAQGTISNEQLEQLSGAVEPRESAAPPEAGRRGLTAAHVLFALLLLDAGLFWAAYRWPLLNGAFVLPTAILGELLLAVMGLVQGRAHPLRISYVVMALSIACAAIDVFSTGRLIWADVMTRAIQGIGPPELTSLLRTTRQAALFGSLWRVSASVIGMIAIYFERRETP